MTTKTQWSCCWSIIIISIIVVSAAFCILISARPLLAQGHVHSSNSEFNLGFDEEAAVFLNLSFGGMDFVFELACMHPYLRRDGAWQMWWFVLGERGIREADYRRCRGGAATSEIRICEMCDFMWVAWWGSVGDLWWNCVSALWVWKILKSRPGLYSTPRARYP